MDNAEYHRIWRKNNPDKERAKKEKWRKANMEKVNSYQKQKRKENPEVEREKKYKKLYGITLHEYNKMYEEQKGKCSICGEFLEVLYVDHDHKSGIVRGLLCNKCNTGIGFFKDTISLLESAIHYLKK